MPMGYSGRQTTPLGTSPLSSSFCHLNLLSMMLTGSGIYLRSVGVRCPSCVRSQPLVHPQSTHWWGGARSRKSLACVTSAQQYRKHPCPVNTVYSTNLNYNLILASMKKINSIPAKTSTLTKKTLQTTAITFFNPHSTE